MVYWRIWQVTGILSPTLPMNHKYFLLTLLTLLARVSVMAQTSLSTGVVMPPLPDAASLVRTVDHPISTYTGIPGITIPLWTVQLKNYSLPIALNYNAGGVKIEEEASNVGLSWSLQAGSVITRVVKDIPDDYNKNRSIIAPQDRPFDSSMSSEHPRLGRFWSGKYETLRDFDFSNNDHLYVKDAIQNSKQYYLGFVLDGMNDLEPDVFYYSFGGKSGKFVFDVRGGNQYVTLLPYQDVKITHTLATNGEIASFTVTDSDGTRYTFDQVERIKQRADSYAGSGPYITFTEYNSSWYLSSITTVNEETITFTYSNENVNQCSSESRTGAMGRRSGQFYDEVTSEGCTFTESATKKRLIQIATDKERISFTAGQQRLDLREPGFAITAIDIRSSSNNPIKSFSLSYSYFQSPTAEPLNVLYPQATNLNTYYKRLKLQSVTEQNGAVTLPPYVFTYEESTPLPNRCSYQQDIWGYFNGATSNVTNRKLFPTMYVYPGYQGSDRYRVYPACNYPGPLNYNMPSYTLPGADRLPNATAAKVGTIKRITYPTGGYTDFDYELNTFRYDGCDYEGGGIRIKSVKRFGSVGSAQPATATYYSYQDEVTGNSTGRIVSMPLFAVPNDAAFYYYDTPQVALGATNGSYVGYQCVRETFGSQAEGGSIRYEYSTPAMHGETTDPLFGLYQLSQVKWWDNHDTTLDPDFITFRNQYHLLPNTLPFPPNTDYDWNRGKLLKQTLFNATGEKVKEVVNTYQIYTSPRSLDALNVFGLRIGNILQVYASDFGDENYSGPTDEWAFTYSKYSLVTNRANVLASTQTTTFHSASPAHTQTIRYAYSSTGHMNPTEVSVDQSDGKSTVTRFHYPLDYSGGGMPLDPAILKLQMQNIISAPIETTVYAEDGTGRKLVAATLTQYQLNAAQTRVLPSKVYRAEIPTLLTDFQESSIELERLKFDSHYREEVSFEVYDTKNNPTQARSKQQGIQSYIWDYNRNYLVAQTQNAQLSDIAYTGFEGGSLPTGTGAGTSGGWTFKGPIQTEITGNKYLALPPLQNGTAQNLTKSGLNPATTYQLTLKYKDDYGSILGGATRVAGPDAQGWSTYQTTFSGVSSFDIGLAECYLDEIRLHPVGALMTTYTYQPLVGITSKTDPSGYTLYYEYDELGRLLRTRDEQGHILTQQQYHYGQ